MENNVLDTRLKRMEKQILYLTALCSLLAVTAIFLAIRSPETTG